MCCMGLWDLLWEAHYHLSCPPRRPDQLLGRTGSGDQVNTLKMFFLFFLSDVHCLQIYLCKFQLPFSPIHHSFSSESIFDDTNWTGIVFLSSESHSSNWLSLLLVVFMICVEEWDWFRITTFLYQHDVGSSVTVKMLNGWVNLTLMTTQDVGGR